jgi:hypothetical protein
VDEQAIGHVTLEQTLQRIKYHELLAQGEQCVVDYLAQQPETVRETVSMYIVHRCFCGAGAVSLFVLDAVQPLAWAIDGYCRMRCNEVASLLLGSFVLARRLDRDSASPTSMLERFQKYDLSPTLAASFDDVDELYFSRIAHLNVDDNAPGWEVAPKAIDKIASLYTSRL